MPDPYTHQKGLLGEATAEQHLIALGMLCIDRRYHSPYGEIDLIMLDKQVLVFVEVKARTRSTLQQGQLAVTPAKKKRIIQTALCYLNQHPEHQERLIRFDIVSISGDCIQHFPNAFCGFGW